MEPIIREKTPDDYPAMVEINNAEWPDHPTTVEEWRFEDEHKDPKCKFKEWVVEVDGEVVAFFGYDQWSGMYHPRKYSIYGLVHPNFQGKGIGSVLYEYVMDQLRELDPLVIRAYARENRVRGVEFLKARGFKEEMRAWESRLDVGNFDFAPYANIEEKPRTHGIEIKTVKELEGDPDRDRRLYELDMELMRDVPSPDRRTDIPYEAYLDMVMRGPDFRPEAYFVAVHNCEYVGMSNLWVSQASKDLYTDLTGVKREYRHKGIALALKIRGIRYAKEHGHPVIKTWNETNNRPILEINERLGFVKQPADITFCKVLKEEGQ